MMKVCSLIIYLYIFPSTLTFPLLECQLWFNYFFWKVCIFGYLYISGCTGVVLPTVWENGYPDGPEMDAFSVQLKQFVADWESMEHTITCSYAMLDITNKTPQDILQEMICHMESMWSGLSVCFMLSKLVVRPSHSLYSFCSVFQLSLSKFLS